MDHIQTMSTNITLPEAFTTTAHHISIYFQKLIQLIEFIPGGAIIIRYIKSSHKNDPFRTFLELILVIFAIRYFTTKRYESKKRGFVKLSEKEVKELVDEWEPEPLVLPVTAKEQWRLDAIPIVEKPGYDSKLKLQETSQSLVNLASVNFLNLSNDEQTTAEAKRIIRQNGVGACGPPNFYGNQDIHIDLEQNICKFFGVEGCVLYGQDFATTQSVLPSFLKRGDYVIADAGINISIQKALLLSRANVTYYNHNDLNHLEDILKEFDEEVYKYEKGPIPRKFIVTEGLFANTGDIPYLPKLIELKTKHKYRLFVDETLSIGSLGKSGRGVSELFGIPVTQVDIIVGSLATSLNAAGGFCIGDHVMTYHQRIGSLAYCFSASLPAYVTKVASTVLHIIDSNKNEKGESQILSSLHSKISAFYNLISKDQPLSKLITVTSSPESPIVHLQLNSTIRTALGLPASYTGIGSEIGRRNKLGISDKFIEELNNEEKLLQYIINLVKSRGILITRSTFTISQESLAVLPHLKICINDGVSKDELTNAFNVIKSEVTTALTGLTADGFQNL
ncbi:hypothetical protein WICPIJ_000909 [Wickerhamomyces pijperi]|uniref:serine C-palmitoyltransferase n=1 Tax=Wickerhamomyces pijperi TaxID=599730 RepID=A0A9P8QCT0_WICPI|nr:hypothetical protein WICPIJ_000909 [Wickerhamomyces pijperi]